MKQKVLAVQLPAPCPLSCEWCRTPEHNIGDHKKIKEVILQHLPLCDEIYLTSNGETGLFPGFNEFIQILLNSGKRISVLCATKASIRIGLNRVEISLNKFTEEIAKNAIYKAKEFKIPVVISIVDDGSTTLDPKQIAEDYGVDAVLIRALQKEGLSNNTIGTTQYFKTKDDLDFGIFPIPAYREITPDDTIDIVCINHFGQEVPYLGSVA